MKVLGNGDLSRPFVVADAVSGSARTKIEAADGSVSILEVPSGPKAFQAGRRRRQARPRRRLRP
jgi:hypothetical protein